MPVANAYLGTSEFAATVLRILAASPHRPALVVTPPDRPAGRGRKLSAPPVATAAGELGLPLHQTRSVNEPGSVATLREAGAEVGCVCAFGQLIGEPLLSEVPMLNVHPSLLPRWRGAAPIERAIMAGDAETGVAVMRLTEGLDSGPVAIEEREPIGPADTYGSLAPRLAETGGRMLVRALDLLEAGELRFEEQPAEGVTYADKIGAADRRLDPARTALELERMVRALSPHVGAFFALGPGERLGVRSAAAIAEADLTEDEPAPDPEPGSTAAAGRRLLVRCGEGILAVDGVQPAGKRAMDASEWLRGHEPPARVGGTGAG